VNLIDTNANLGPWPFAPVPDRTGAALAAHLAAAGIRRALVSHLGALFLPEPMPANRALFATVRRTPGLIPVPVLNPALPNWREQLAECLAAGPIRAVKILPNYHRYRLNARHLDDFMAALAKAKLRLILNVRLEDERHKYFALRIKGVPVPQVAQFLRRFRSHHVLLSGIYKTEVEKLAPDHENFSVEISLCEMTDTLEIMLKKFPARRFMLGTDTPVMATRAQAAKLTGALIPARTRELIGSGNARRFFRL